MKVMEIMKPALFGFLFLCAVQAANGKPEVEADITDKGQTSELVFYCKFPQDDVTFYTVQWTVNNVTIKRFNPERHSDVRSNTVLTEAILKENRITKPGFQLQCGVETHSTQDGPKNPIQNSEKTFIGIKILNKEITVVEGECKPVGVQLTAPFGCGADKDDCALSTKVVNKNKNTGVCSGKVVMRTSCGAKIEKSNWNTPVNFEVCGQIAIQYGSLSVTRKLGIKTASFFSSHTFWQDYDIGEITVRITRETSSIKGKRCSAVNDPHMTTFNGRRYEHHMDGMFTLYKHLKLPVEVQLQTRLCRNRYKHARCNCGLIIRVGQTVFMFNHCGRSTWYIDYKQYQPKDPLEITQDDGSTYQLKLPTGGHVKVQLNGIWLNVYIYPSVKDKEQTGGLCGKLTTQCAQEMTLRNGHVSNDPSANTCSRGSHGTYYPIFSENWRVEAEDSLFKDDLKLKPLPSEIYCTCPKQEDGEAKCSAQEASEECMEMPGFKVTPLRHRIGKRGKRSVATSQFIRIKRNPLEPNWRNDWTEEKARVHCQEMFNSSKSVEMCRHVPNVEMQPSEENCVSDIQFLGSDDFMMAALDDVRSKCVHEVMMDPEMHNRTDEGKPSMLDMLMDFVVCPNECNHKGNCTKGKCKCEMSFGGNDCSVDLTVPPMVSELQQNEGCDLGKCNVTSVYGETFVDSPQLKCRVKQLKVFEDASVEEGGVKEVAAEVMSISEVDCHLPEIISPGGANKTYVNGFRVSVSNTGTLYSGELDMLVLDRQCQRQVNKDQGDLKWERHGSPHCIHNGRCVAQGATKPDGTVCHLQQNVDIPNGVRTQGPFRYWGVTTLCVVFISTGFDCIISN